MPIFLVVLFHFEVSPQAAWDASPHGGYYAPSPVYDPHMLASIDCSYHLFRHFLGLQQHGILRVVAKQGGGNKARSQVGERDIQSSHARLLLERLDVGVLKSLGSRVGRSSSQSLGSSDAAYCCDVSATVLCHVTIAAPIMRVNPMPLVATVWSSMSGVSSMFWFPTPEA